MPRKKFTAHGRKELLVNRRRFTVLNLLLVAVMVVAAYWVYVSAFAAVTVTISGKVTLDGVGWRNRSVSCNNGTVTTNSSGNYSCTIVKEQSGDRYYHVRVLSVPGHIEGGPTKKTASHPEATTYEWQVPGYDCYNGSNKNYCRDLDPRSWEWDLAVDTGLNFRYTTKPQCRDGRDNDGDGRIDYGSDPGCATTSDTSESPDPVTPTPQKPQCSDGKDNDGDGLIDYGRDPGCATTVDNTESPNPSKPKPPVKPPIITNPVPGSGGSPSTPDTTKPTIPGEFKANLGSDPSNVILSWKPSTDASGIKNYQIDRSTDRAKWSTLTGKATGNSFTDTHTEYKTAYFYRIRATDNAGNRSGYVQADITTGEFKPTDEGSTILSEDGVVQALLPDGSLGKDVSCSITSSDTNSSSLRGVKLELIHGPYLFACKDKEGSFIESFKIPIEFTVTPDPEKAKKFQNLTIMKYNSDTLEWEVADITSEDQEGNTIIKFSSDKPTEFALMGEPKPGLPWGIISFIIFILLAIGGAFIFLLRRAQAQHYQDYLRRKYYNL